MSGLLWYNFLNSRRPTCDCTLSLLSPTLPFPGTWAVPGWWQAMEALAKLQRNLREEQKLIVQRMIVFHQCTLKPRQVRAVA